MSWLSHRDIALLSHSARAAPLLLLGTYRGDELDRAHPLYQIFPALVREADVTRVDLAPLTRDAIRSLVHARYALADEDERRLAAYLTVRSEGNALFCIELMRTLEEEGFLHLRDSDWTLHDLTRARVPLLLRQVIAARLARLGAEADRLLSVAAIIGSEAPLDLWGTVSDTEEDVLLDLVERAVAARVLDETADGNVVRFAHALIRDSLYEGMLASRRRVWHRRIAEAMAATPQPDPDAVAYHFRQAGDARAVGWFVEAGERAQRAYAHMTAGDRFEAALALMRDGEPDPRERGWLLYRLVVSRRFERNPQAIAQLDEAARLAAEAGDRALAAHVLYYKGHLAAHALDLSRALVNIEAALVELESLPAADTAWLIGRNIIEPGTGWGTFINWLAFSGHFARTRTVARQHLVHTSINTERWTESASDAAGYMGLAYVDAQQGDVRDARQMFARGQGGYGAHGYFHVVGIAIAMEIAYLALPFAADDVAERRRLAAAGSEAIARGNQVLRHDLPTRFGCLPLLVLEGAWDEARQVALSAHELNFSGWSVFASVILGALAYMQGDTGLAWRMIHERLPDGPRTCLGTALYYLIDLHLVAAALAVDAEDYTVARAWLEAHDRWLAWSGAVLGQADGHLGWAAFFRAAGDSQQAAERATLALTHAADPRQPLALLAAHRLLGELATEAGDFDDAATHLDAALALADACAAPYERALTLLARADVRAATGRRAEARALLDEARAICVPLGAKPALARADALTARLTATRPTPAAFPAGLSAREVEVLRLVAEGLTDAQVAERLSLSPRTVGRHLTSIYRKLGVASRAAATRFAVEQRLT